MIQDNLPHINRMLPQDNPEIPSSYSVPNEGGTAVVSRPTGWPTRPQTSVTRMSEHGVIETPPSEVRAKTAPFDDSEEYRRAYLLYWVRTVREKDGKAAAESALIEAVRMIDR